MEVNTQGNAGRSGAATGRTAPWCRLALAAIALALTSASGGAAAADAPGGAKPSAKATTPHIIEFDHTKTGFELLGYHRQVACEECHVKGVFRGTPRNCATCHSVGSRFVSATTMSPQHFPVGNKACDDCHVTSDWSSVNVRHDSAMAGKCNTCHDGIHASGKSANHFPTQNASCDYCHSTVAWQKAYFDHSAFVSVAAGVGTFTDPMSGIALTTGGQATPRCSSCHNGSQAQGPGAGHIPVPAGADCISCHGRPPIGPITLANYSSAWVMTGVYVHSNFAISNPSSPSAKCSYCHNNTYEIGKGGNHLPTAGECNVCHTAAIVDVRNNGAGFAGAVMSHTGITAGCATCHDVGKAFQNIAAPTLVTRLNTPPAHVPTTLACETCHGTSVPTPPIAGGFRVATMNHQGISANCASCHLANTATGMTIQGNMVIQPQLGMGAHIATGQVGDKCEACHSPSGFTNFQGAVMTHQGIGTTGGCSACHESTVSFAGLANVTSGPGGPSKLVVRPAGLTASGFQHPATGDCSGCHNSFTSFTISVSGTGMPTGHIPTTQTCSLCHAAGYGLGKTVMNHSGSSASCGTCHGVSFTTTVNGAAGAAFTPVGTNTAGVVHIGVSGADCSACHAAAAPTVTVSAATPTYSAPGGFRLASYPANLHAYVSTSSCATCHDASASTTFTGIAGKVSNIAAPVGSIVVNPNTVAGCATGNGNAHGALGECSSCHTAASIAVPSTASTGFCAAQNTVPANHIPYAGSCATSCHAAGYGYGKTVMDHNQASGACSTCHVQGAAHAFFNTTPAGSTADGTHIVVTSSDCSLCHAKPTATQVITSATQYNNGFRVTLSNAFLASVHTYVSTSCGNCHAASAPASYGQVGMKLAPANHIPNPGGTACTVCHVHAWPGPIVGGFAFTTAMQMVHTGIVTGCSACHDPNSYYFGPLTIKLRPAATVSGSVCTPSNNGVAHPTSGDCSTCHSDTTIPSAGTLGFCKATSMPPNHIPIGSQACSLCHASGFGIGSGVMNHAGNTYPCTTCHGTTSPIAFFGVTPMYAAQPGPHIPLPSSYGTPNTSACNICHVGTGVSGTSVGGFATGSRILHSHVTVSTGTCVPCHLSPGTMITGPESVTKKAPGHQSGSQGISTTPVMPSCDVCHNHTTSGFP